MDKTDQLLQEQIEYYQARASQYDEWHLRQGRYFRGEEHRQTWFAELDAARAALDQSQPHGRILELACGTGLWTAQLASAAENLTAVDASPETIAINRERSDNPDIRYLEADLFAWRPEETWDFIFFGFWLSHVPQDRFDSFWETVRLALEPGGRVFFVDSLLTQDSTAKDHALVDSSGIVERRLNDGSVYSVVKNFHDPTQLQGRLADLGWRGEVHQTGRFFLYGWVTRLRCVEAA